MESVFKSSSRKFSKSSTGVLFQEFNRELFLENNRDLQGVPPGAPFGFPPDIFRQNFTRNSSTSSTGNFTGSFSRSSSGNLSKIPF